MKKVFLLSFFSCAFSLTGTSQQNFGATILQLKTNDLIYDSVTQRIYATIPSANGTNGNSIGIINPTTVTLDSTIFAGSEPTILARSDNGQFLYAAFSGASIIRRFTLAPFQLDKTIQLGSTGSFSNAPLFANDIEAVPGLPLSIAVSLKVKAYNPTHEGVAIYDDGVKRPTVTAGHTGSNQIEFIETQDNTVQLFGYNHESTEFGLRRHTLSASGVATNDVYKNLFSGFFIDFIAVPGKLYSTTGTAVDIIGLPYVAGQFSTATGPVAYDGYQSKVCYAANINTPNGTWGGSIGPIVFRRFNPNNYLQSDSTAFPQLVEKPLKLITCGPNCYALNTDGGKVIILKPQPAGVQGWKVNAENALLFPNPAGDFVNLTVTQDVKKVTIFSLDGRVVLTSWGAQPKIEVTALTPGMYNVVIEGTNGQQTLEKLLKK